MELLPMILQEYVHHCCSEEVFTQFNRFAFNNGKAFIQKILFAEYSTIEHGIHKPVNIFIVARLWQTDSNVKHCLKVQENVAIKMLIRQIGLQHISIFIYLFECVDINLQL